MIRTFVSLTTAFSFVMLIISSVMLYIVPEGRIAYWAGWSLIFTKAQWGALHITGGVLFIIFGIWHSCLNIKPLLSYCKIGISRKKRTSLLLAGTVCIIVYGGTLMNMPPMSQLVAWNAEIKSHQAKKYGDPPFGHAEASTLRQFCAFLGLDVKAVIDVMKKASFHNIPDENSIFKNIAHENNMTPQQLYSFILESFGQTPKVRKGKKLQN